MLMSALLLISRQVSPSEFKGTWYVNVREYYEKVRHGWGLAAAVVLVLLYSNKDGIMLVVLFWHLCSH